jgi:hypothetical protein
VTIHDIYYFACLIHLMSSGSKPAPVITANAASPAPQLKKEEVAKIVSEFKKSSEWQEMSAVQERLQQLEKEKASAAITNGMLHVCC